jgi:hypothetical protein
VGFWAEDVVKLTWLLTELERIPGNGPFITEGDQVLPLMPLNVSIDGRDRVARGGVGSGWWRIGSHLKFCLGWGTVELEPVVLSKPLSQLIDAASLLEHSFATSGLLVGLIDPVPQFGTFCTSNGGSCEVRRCTGVWWHGWFRG